MGANVRGRLTTTGALEVRATVDEVVVEGYASTFDQPYDMGWYEETVERGAFTKTLSESPDVRYLINHDGLPLARTSSGTLDLAQDTTGLHTRARLDPADPDVQRVLPKMRRGDLDAMSFGFRVIRQEWSPDHSQRAFKELSLAGGDVSIVTYPANPNTSVSARARQILDTDPAELRALYVALKEERLGKTISAATQQQLESVLESLNTIDQASDDAVEVIATILDTGPGNAGEDDPGIGRSRETFGTHPTVVRERLRLAGLTIN